jgi:Zn-dependent peptidase ImmA (M78 family)
MTLRDLDKLKKMEAGTVTEAVEGSGEIVKDFLKFAVRKLNLTQLPKIKFQKNFSPQHHATFGYFDPDTDHIVIVVDNRHPMDVMRTLAHELVHYTQRINNQLADHSGETGSKHENQANAAAGVLMRDFGRQNPKYFEEK